MKPLRGHGREAKVGGEDWECLGSAHQTPEKTGDLG